MNTLPGLPHPLGATWDGHGVNFALYSEHAERVELCLFDDQDNETRIPLPHHTAFVWHGYVPGLQPGQRYGYRVHGPYEPQRGLRFNPNLVLLDPYAKALATTERWERGCFAYAIGSPEQDLRFAEEPGLGAPRAMVVDPGFDWDGDVPPRTPLHRTVIYEAHVRGLTMRHPALPPALRGTYAGVAHPAVIEHLTQLGVTAIELMPVHAFVDDKHLLDKGLRNYWGYNSIGFFAPDVRYRMGNELGQEVVQFKQMVKALHRAGIEVILDVVYNHTAEGNHLGPTFSFKGIDNPTYYRLVSGDERHYFDYTGTGNTLNVRHPQVLALIMDSLRYWAEEMHVDGFRFDLASALARQLHDVDRLSSFFTLIHDSPTLREVKLIAEPWDVGHGGYQVGNFPVRWAEWNGRYRDTMRSFWKGDGGRAADLGFRLTGSSDLYEASGRKPSASINFITAHDGATLRDLVSYNHKHNEANGENNADGNNDEHSWNCGAEGPTDDPEILNLRRRQQRNLLATLLLSQGTPMILAGDECGRTQNGNNNAYCQDNEIGWFDWDWGDEQRALFEFTRRVLALRKAHPALHRSKFFQGRPIQNADLSDLAWFRHDGLPMSQEDWQDPSTQSLVMFLAGRGIGDVDDAGRPLVDDNLLLAINASHLDLELAFPDVQRVDQWELILDTTDDRADGTLAARSKTTLGARSLKLFRAPARVVRSGGALHTLGSTYRLQLHRDFGFRAALEQLDYLAKLGVTDLYLSPIFAAATGSTHGYDVVSHEKLNPELGTLEDFQALAESARTHGMGILVDWVPNHMGNAAGQNAWWEDVLENGPSSLHAVAFDIDWNPVKEELRDTVLLPVLADQFGQVLERGDLRVELEGGSFFVRHMESRFPAAPKSLLPLISDAVAATGLSELHPAQQELESLRASLFHLPNRRETSEETRRERAREKEVFKRRLERLMRESPEVAQAVARAVEKLNGTPGEPASFDALDRFLGEQSYRLASWRVASQEINYRRFFDVNALVALRVEEPVVFERAHRLLFQLLNDGLIQAIRLDHTDGLFDPLAYFEQLQRHFRGTHPPGAYVTPDDAARPLPILVEKILEAHEKLPAAWPVDGTTGYEFAAAAIGVSVDASVEPVFTQIYQEFTGDRRSFSEHVYESKIRILKDSLASEVNMLARRLERIAVRNRAWRDFTLVSLTRALSELLAAFPVYRTYLRLGSKPDVEDERTVTFAIAQAQKNAGADVDPSVFEFIRDLLLSRKDASPEERLAQNNFALRFQQLTGPVMAKSVEDTAFYRYQRLIALNEVGGDPASFGLSTEAFHAQYMEQLRSWPLGMLTTSTHDTKRGEDAAARLAVLTEMPQPWRDAVREWSALNHKYRTEAERGLAPSRRDEYMYYQALLGAWPFGWDGERGLDSFIQRMQAFMQKATNEAKEETSWIAPSPRYDAATASFVERSLSDPEFRKHVRSLGQSIEKPAVTNSLAKVLLRVCGPGVPDTYQGSELWNQSLVDPDNRRPVDYSVRRALLAEIEAEPDREALIRRLLDKPADGAVKLFVTQTALSVRKRFRQLFVQGEYSPLETFGHALAFARTFGSESIVVCVPRLPYRLTQGKPSWPMGKVWRAESVVLPVGRYRDAFTGRTLVSNGSVKLAVCFAAFPVALLISEPAAINEPADALEKSG